MAEDGHREVMEGKGDHGAHPAGQVLRRLASSSGVIVGNYSLKVFPMRTFSSKMKRPPPRRH